MSAVTLETLRADFEAAVYEVAKGWSVHSFDPARLSDPDTYVADWGYSADDDLDHLPSDEAQAQRKADQLCQFYLLARDHGLQAAMMFKLSDGAIDPRVKA